MFGSVSEMKVFWVVGAMERLATLGFLESPPLTISQESIDLFLEVDEIREGLFSDENELKNIIEALVKSHNHCCDKQLVNDLFHLVRDYKNERARVFKAGLTAA